MVEDGRVYAALSPLYHVSKGTKNWTYFLDKKDFIRYVRDEFYKHHSLLHGNKKNFTKTELTTLIVNNNKYDEILETIANNYAIYPILLEDLLLLRKSNFTAIKKAIEKKYPYITVRQEKGQVVVDGLANDMSHLFAFNANLIAACVPIVSFLDKNENKYLLDGKKIGLYELIKTYRQSEPKNIERAKGLGSLDASEIGYSTLDPARRMLIKYTTADIEEEIQQIRSINDDQYQLIKDLDISQYEF